MKVIKVNPDNELVKTIRLAIRENHGYCPCALEHTDDTLCICKDFRTKVINGYVGECHCGLYISLSEEEKTNE